MKKYITSKEECESKINKDYVCDRCGRKIVAMETRDNSGHPTFWAGCWHKDNPDKDDWGNFTNGVPKQIYELAEKLVCEEGGYYSHINKSEYKKTLEDRKYWFQSQMAGWCSLLMTIEYLKNNQSRKTKEEVLNDPHF